MAADFTTTPAVDDATKLDDYTRLRDTTRALAAAMGGLPLWGWHGDLDDYIEDTTEVTLPKACGDVGQEIDGTHLGYVAVYLEIVARRRSDAAGTVTCTVDLYNVSDGAVVASSATAISLTSTADFHAKSVNLTLPASVKRFRARIKTSDTTRAVAARVRVVAKGS
jgi:hypothetical protein